MRNIAKLLLGFAMYAPAPHSPYGGFYPGLSLGGYPGYPGYPNTNDYLTKND